MEDNIQTLMQVSLYLIIDISREGDVEVRSNASSSIFDRVSCTVTMGGDTQVRR